MEGSGTRWFLRFVWVLLLLSPLVFVEPAPYDILLIILFVTGSAFSLLRFNFIPPKAMLMLGIFLLGNLISLFFAPDMGRAVRFLAITAYLVLSWIFFTGLIGRFGEKALKTIFSGYTTGAVITASVTSLVVLGVIPHLNRLVFTDSAGELRAQGLFKDPNVFGSFLVPIALYALIQRQNARGMYRVAWIAVFSVVTIGVFLSFSRGAWGNYVLALAVYLLLPNLQSLKQRAKTLLPNLLVSLPLLASIIHVPKIRFYLQKRLGERSYGQKFTMTQAGASSPTTAATGTAKLQKYDQERFGTQETALKAFAHHLLGIGPGQSEVVFNYATHSLYVRVLVENGLLGFSFIIFALWPVVRGIALMFRRKGSAWLHFSVAVLIGQLFNSFFIDTLHWRHLWLFLAICWIYGVKSNENSLPDYSF